MTITRPKYLEKSKMLAHAKNELTKTYTRVELVELHQEYIDQLEAELLALKSDVVAEFEAKANVDTDEYNYLLEYDFHYLELPYENYNHKMSRSKRYKVTITEAKE